MLFWSTVDFTSDRLLLNVLWTDWVCLGTRLEQIDLMSDFGEVYGKISRACSDAHSLASSNWDVVHSLGQLLFPPQQFWMRRDSDPGRHPMLLPGLLATWIRARRALSIDPVTLLREESVAQ